MGGTGVPERGDANRVGFGLPGEGAGSASENRAVDSSAFTGWCATEGAGPEAGRAVRFSAETTATSVGRRDGDGDRDDDGDGVAIAFEAPEDGGAAGIRVEIGVVGVVGVVGGDWWLGALDDAFEVGADVGAEAGAFDGVTGFAGRSGVGWAETLGAGAGFAG